MNSEFEELEIKDDVNSISGGKRRNKKLKSRRTKHKKSSKRGGKKTQKNRKVKRSRSRKERGGSIPLV